MENVEITKEVQETINYVMKYEPDLNFKVCKTCGRSLPAHEWFYEKCSKGEKSYFVNACKECDYESDWEIKYTFTKAMDMYWHTYVLDEISNLARVMTDTQLAKHYDKPVTKIERILYAVLKVNQKDRSSNLSKEEILRIYRYICSGERKLFPKKFFDNERRIILLKHLFDDVLYWNIQDILENFNFSTLDEKHLYGLRKNIKFIDIIDLVNNIYHTDYRIWEFKKTTSSHYFDSQDNVDEAIQWFKEKVAKDHNVFNIYDAYNYGLHELVDQYKLYHGIVKTKYNSKHYDFYEAVFQEKFDMEHYKNNNYPFDILLEPISLNNKSIIYELTNEYYNLDDIGKTIINDMIRYCDANNKFPTFSDLLIKDGYISYDYYKKYFGTMENVNKYIYKLDLRPEKMICNDCKEEFSFTEEFFTNSKTDRYGLLYQCKKCNSKYTMRSHYRKIGIVLQDGVTEIPPEQWWEYIYNGIIPKMPDFCFEVTNMIKIIRHVFFNKLKLVEKDEFLNTDNYNVDMNTELKISGIYCNFTSKKEMFQKSFPEYNFVDSDFNIYNDENTNKIIKEWIKANNFKTLDLLKNGNTSLFDKEIYNLYVTRFCSITNMFLWYFDYNNIHHPKNKHPITVFDFRQKPFGFWDDANNRIFAIKNHCENVCKISINDVKHDTNLLKEWLKKNFTSNKICKYFTYTGTLYDLLAESYPEIKDSNILFGWEWVQNKNGTYSREYLIKCLRELVIYRMNDLIIDIEEDLPRYINNSYINMIYPRFNQHKNDNFKSYYEWSCLAFPEYASKWRPEDFGSTYAFDGSKCDSIQEKMAYEYMKRELGLDYIMSMGRKHSGKHIIEVDKEIYGFKKCCPDFVIEKILKNEEVIILNKKVYIEYYGLFNEDHANKIFINYVKKTHLKNEIYNSLDNIIFIALYPSDLKNNYEGVKNKINNMLLKVS